MNISDYDVIYNERVYKCIDFQMRFKELEDADNCSFKKPRFLDVVCVNEDGNIIIINDEAWRFRFVRKQTKE